MLIHNRTTKRCLLLSKDSALIESVKNVLHELNFQIDLIHDRKTALKCFIQYRHYFFLIDAEFLPRYPYRLLQFFKMAHRTPGVVIFNGLGRDLTGFNYLKDGIIEIVESPYDKETLVRTFNSINKTLTARTKSLFVKDLLVQVGIALPLIAALVYFLVLR